MKHLLNICNINGAEVEPVDIITFGSPCQDLSVAGKRTGIHEGERSNLFFQAIRIIKEMREATNGEYPKYAVWENVCFAAGTLVTCEGGYKPIERVFVGEKVKTLSGKYLPVVKVHKTKRQNVLNLSVSGGEDLVVTGNHPFYARQKTYDTGGRKTITDAQWTEAKDLTAKHLIAYRIDEPTLPEHFISETDAWILGRWLADGSVDLTKANPRIFISVGNAKLEEVRDKLRSLPYEFYENKPHDTVTNFIFTSNEFYSLIAECGIGAGQKRVAPFIFTLPHTLQQRVLEGYMSGDGYTRKRFNGTEITAATASRELAYGIARLIRNCYKTSANISCRPARNGLIDGRVIKANYPSYNITACIGGKSSQGFFDGEFVWQPVRSIRPLKEKQDVYNLSVLEDNTYAANDIICHNCGAFSSNKGYDFYAVLQAFCSVCDDTVSIPRPYDRGRTDRLVWLGAGEIVGDSYSVAWRTLDAQYWGVPQRRKRIYLVADFTGRCAGEILFKQEGLRGDSAQGNETGQGASADAMGSVDGSVGVECYDARENGDGETACFTMQRSDEYQVCNVASTQSVRQYKSATDLIVEKKRRYIIRRLTPTECARFQGFPDWWSELAPYDPADAEFWEQVRKTHAEINGKKYKPTKNLKKWYEGLHTDSAEYKMWGNGIALPCAEYVLRGIAEQGAKTLGSLFDGSGGFPLAGVMNGIKPLWASEVEPYPIAVTKSRFKEVHNGK